MTPGLATPIPTGLVPATLTPTKGEPAGATFQVRRAWPSLDRPDPHRPDRVAVELLDQAGRIRGGLWSPAGLEVFEVGADPALPALGEVSGEVVSHRPGKRVVVRTDGHWAKVVRPGKERRILAGTERAVAFAEAFRLPQIVDHRSGLVVSAHLSGRSLAHGSGWADTDWEQAWSQILFAWAAAGAVPVRERPEVHDAAAEAAVLRRWVNTVPGEVLPYAMSEQVDRGVDALLTGTPSPVRISHRDLHDHQVVWDPVHGPGLLDMDTATFAEAALDLGNLRAHSHWRVLQGHWSPQQAAVVQELIDRTADRADVSPQRLASWENIALLRLVCVHLHRPVDRPRVAALLTGHSATLSGDSATG